MSYYHFLDGRSFKPLDIALWEKAQPKLPRLSHEVGTFLREWFSPSDTMILHTSGSTGKPKRVEVEKERMRASALATCEALGLKAGDTAFFAMSVRYIAGKMMLVRALECGLQLYMASPSGNPLSHFSVPVDFAAMLPMQVYNALKEEKTKARLEQIKQIIIGGGGIDPVLASKISEMPGEVYSTYGMTETLSHIALRRLNGAEPSKSYVPMPGVKIHLNENDAICISAERISSESIVTNDRGQLHEDGSFEVLGRLDNVICSGGLKLQLEEIETALSPLIYTPFALTAVPDERLGEALTLLIKTDNPDVDLDILKGALKNLYPYHRPKYVLVVDKIPLTASKKLAHKKCRQLAEKNRADLIPLSQEGTKKK